MKPVFFKHTAAINDSFFILNDRGPYFYDTLHYHPTYQLTLILEGMGTFFIADHIERFKPGDIFLIGPDLPHVFRCDNEYYKEDSNLQVNGMSAYFRHDSFGSPFFYLPENIELNALLIDAKRGIKVSGATAHKITPQMDALFHLKGVEKITALLLMLNKIAQAPKEEVCLLSSPGFLGSMKNEDNDRMNLVFDFVMKHFTEDISLEEVSEIACMTTTAFCRFFKKRTRKSLFVFVAETRIGYACKLLLEENLSVAQIAYQSGFSNVSNFHRQFKQIMKKTPLAYVKLFSGKDK